MKLKLGISAVFFTLALISLHSCFQEELVELSPADIDFTKVPYENLSEYGFFVGELSDLLPGERVLLYEPVSTLFTDYAHKSRFVWMPEGVSAEILDDDYSSMSFPDKSILIKNFYYPKDIDNPSGEKHIVETRLLVKNEGEWDAYPYLWNEEQTDAIYKVTGASIEMSVTDNDGLSHDIKYVQPNKNQCKSCHNFNEEMMPIGPKARNLNFPIEFADGVEKNQLDAWAEIGYLANYQGSDAYEAMVNYEDVHADLDLRAKAYLDINCGHCHRAEGPASTSGLFMTYEQDEAVKWGVNKTPVAAGKGAGTFTYDVLPGHGDSSITVYRMNSTEPGVMMAELGRSMVHKEGVELIREWIDQMDPAN